MERIGIRGPRSLLDRLNKLCASDEVKKGKRPTQAQKLDELITKEETRK
jgi:hypothetical protein